MPPFSRPVVTLLHFVQGRDVLAKARTGTGKTTAFLLPTIERIVAARANPTTPLHAISCLVVSPTRELASQIAAEANALTTFQSPPVTAHCFFGGTSIAKDQRRLEPRAKLDIMVATPGRLLDLITNMKGVAERLSYLQVRTRPRGDSRPGRPAARYVSRRC